MKIKVCTRKTGATGCLYSRGTQDFGFYGRPAVVHLEGGSVVQLAPHSSSYFERVPSGRINVTMLSGTADYSNGVERQTAGPQDILVFQPNEELTSLYTEEMARDVLGRKPYGSPRRVSGPLTVQPDQGSVPIPAATPGILLQPERELRRPLRDAPTHASTPAPRNLSNIARTLTFSRTTAVVLGGPEATSATPTEPPPTQGSSNIASATDSSQSSSVWSRLRRFLLATSDRPQASAQVRGRPAAAE